MLDDVFQYLFDIGAKKSLSEKGNIYPYDLFEK